MINYIKNFKSQYEKQKTLNRKVYKGNEQAVHRRNLNV